MERWESFYVIIGSAGAALIGIEFVVITLVANLPERPPSNTISAFASPTVVHFASALVLSAVMSAPWRSSAVPALALLVAGLGGVAYAAVVIQRIRHQTQYTPVWQDWLWYAVLPSAAYAVLALAAATLRMDPPLASVGIAASALGLLLIGIHNAWDSVTHIVFGMDEDAVKRDQP
jgi:hypothetical protein